MEAYFIPGQERSLFSILYSPENNSINQAIIHIPAFAEEMNKSRRMVSLQAKVLAASGYTVLILDLFGTGDSTGDFGDAKWRDWLQDVNSAVNWLKQRGIQKIHLWGLRTGALLAMNFINDRLNEIESLICWQPVLNGQVFVTQFLRLRVAAAMMNNNVPKEKTSDLINQLNNDETIEVAGYLLNPDLIKPMLALEVGKLDLSPLKNIMIFEIVSSDESEVSPANTKIIKNLSSQNVQAEAKVIVGSSFWATQEITEAPQLLSETLTNFLQIRPIKMNEEIPIIFHCGSDKLLGILHKSSNVSKVGILLVVGGPQYRVGSHRQFVLLARVLTANGFPVLRFDYRGMGDSEGEVRIFNDINDDIACAIDSFFQHCPDLSNVLIWGLCDAASAALFYAYRDDRIKGLMLLNPWAYTEQGAAKSYLKYYYLQRILSFDLWKKLFSLRFDYMDSLSSLINLLKKLASGNQKNNAAVPKGDTVAFEVDQILDLPDRLRSCLRQFKYPVLIILSGRDLTASEFKEVIKANREWQDLMSDKRISLHDLSEADHTFSSKLWRDQVAEISLTWIQALAIK